MASIETIRRITIDARTAGVEQATARLQDATRAISTMEGAVSRVRRAYDPLFSASEKLASVSRTLQLATAAGNTTQEMANRLYDQAADKITGLSRLKQQDAQAEAKWRAELEKTAAAQAATYQSAINARLGIGGAPASGGEDRGAIMERLIAQQEKEAQQQARLEARYRDDLAKAANERAQAFQSAINMSLGIGRPGSSDDRGAIMERLLDQQDRENQQQARLEARYRDEQAKAAAERANAYQAQINQRLGVREPAQGGEDRGAVMAGLLAQAEALDPLTGAMQKRDAQIEKANAALKAGVINEEQHARAVAFTTTAYVAQERALKTFAQNTDAAGKGVRLTAYELQNLGYQANDVFSSLASGISPMQTLAQQGPQIFQILSGSNGGLRGGLSAVGGVALSAGRALIGFGGALAGATAAMVAAAVAGNSYANSMLAVDRAVAGRGRASGSTSQQIIDAANANSDAGKVTVRQAREMAAEFASTGRIGSEMYGGLIRTAKDYAATTGQDLPTAQKALAEAFADPAKGAETLNAQLGFLNSATLKNIQALAQQGDRLGAQRALMDAYSTGLTRARDLTSGWGAVTEAVGTTVSNMWDRVGQAVANSFTGGETLEARLEEARRLLTEAQGSQGGAVDRLFGNATGEVQRLQGVIAGLQAQIAQRDAQNATARRAQRDLEIKAIIDGYNQSSQTLQKLEREAQNIAKALKEGVIDADGRSMRTMTALREAAAQLKADMAAGGTAYADAVRAAGFENRNVGTTGVALQRARIEEDAQNRSRAAVSSTQDASELFAKLQSIEIERVTRLNTLLKETENQAANAGGALARVSGGLREQIIGAARGAVTPSLIAGIASKESGLNPNIGYTKVLNAAGQPSTTAYGLGQITKGTAEDAVRQGYLPQGFDRTNTDTMAQGIAGVLAMKIDQAGGDVFKGLMNYYGSKDQGANRAYAADVMRRAGQMGDVSTEGLVKSQDALTRAQRDAEQANDNLAKNYGRNGEAAELAAARQQKYNELIDAGRPAAEAASIAFGGMTDKVVQLGRSAKEIQLSRDMQFEREQIGRSEQDQSAFAKARSAFGDTTSAPAQAAIAQQRLNDNLKQTKDLSKEAFSGFVSDVMRGTTALGALQNMLSRLADRLLSTFADKAFAGIFSGLAGTPGGGGIDLGISSWMPKFANGGIMTSQGPLPLRAYAAGGIATGPQLALYGEGRMNEAYVPLPDGKRIPVAMQGTAPAAQSGGGAVVVNMTGQEAKTERVNGPQGARDVIVIGKTIAGSLMSDPDVQKAMRQAYGLRKVG